MLFIVRIIVLFFALTPGWAAPGRKIKRDTFKAAVHEHSPISQPDPKQRLSRKQALFYAEKNLKAYIRQAKSAFKKGADIIVYPENGLYGYDHTRNSIKPYLEELPDPKDAWVPCEDPWRYTDNNILRKLSCIAWTNYCYVVANMGEKQECDGRTDPYCPADGQYQYSTNVVFDSEGRFIAKYRKFYLYWQPMFDHPRTQEFVTWDTEFGKMGTLVSGDLFFESPAIDLVRLYNVSTIAVPMTWDNTFPYPSVVNVQQGFAISQGVNLLAANTKSVKFSIGGSGIYSGNGAIRYKNYEISSRGKLLIANVPIIPYKQGPIKLSNSMRKIRDEKTQFQKIISGDKFKLYPLNKFQDNIRICDAQFCCSLSYMFGSERTDEYFAFGVFNGAHEYLIKFSVQACGLVRCSTDLSGSCGELTNSSKTVFSQIKMWGDFDASASVFPYVNVDGRRGRGIAPGRFNYSNGVLNSIQGFQAPLISVILLGRKFTDDPKVTMTTMSETTVHPSTENDVKNILVPTWASVIVTFAVLNAYWMRTQT